MGHGGIYQNNDYSILQRIGEITGTSPRIAYEVNEFAIKMLLVSQGSGIAYIPEVCLPMAKAIAPDIRLFTIEDFSTTRSVLIARKPRESMTSAANDFWDFALEYYHLPPDLEE